MTEYGRHFGRGGLNEYVDVDRLVEGIGLDEDEIDWRKSFIGFDDSDCERLEAFDEIFQAHADEFADSFYDHLTRHQETADVFDRSPKSTDELKRTQKAYLTTLAGGTYDESYFRNRARIGKLHDLVDMPIKHYLGQYNVYYGLLFSLVTDRMHEQLTATVDAELERAHSTTESGEIDSQRLSRRIYEDVEDGIDDLHSLFKLLNLDIQVAVDTYMQSRLDAIETERDRFAALFENVPSPVVIVRFTSDGERVEAVNEAFEELFGYTAADLAGDESFEEALRPPGEEPTPIEGRSLLAELNEDSNRKLIEAEVTLETMFGRREFVRVSAPVDRSGIENLEYAFYIDVTDQKQRQERLQVLSRVLRHDIRTQMNLVKGCATSLGDADGVDTDRRREMADLIDEAADDLLSMSNRIRSIERVVAGQADRRPIDATALLEDVVADVGERYPDCAFSLSAPERLWLRGGDSLHNAIANVVENGAEHNDAADPSVEVSLVESLGGDHVTIRVADNGPGIPPSEYEVLTGERDRSQIEHSSGLGLWMVNWVVTKVGGALEFDANAPRGSIVTVRLPRAEPPS
ncbi:protoglobin domain-containing protein [Natrarchaeobaculum sulfurireducens]|uniref:histidine kinase n=1 Tax=Natrarchaeobaculum sulfurireducens TaxID=2044521 RepID=A0A346PDD5_9EURY|nr:protoglobin domain-containing protein [Natrarchaeobaculum sulfurireducens]AXR77530.1 Signal transduction histidine kinase with PAS domain [Natrarchaeobaculum sulfurireducens]AXR82527.1 signal-transducing histidine kinase [Natrarchaeobaculum sulfurireducens]